MDDDDEPTLFLDDFRVEPDISVRRVAVEPDIEADSVEVRARGYILRGTLDA